MTNILNGQTALITGATRGIGRAIATALGKEGATVIGTATSDEEQAVSTTRLGPCNPRMYDSRPEATLKAQPVPK